MAEVSSESNAALNVVSPTVEKIDTLLTADQLENFGLKSPGGPGKHYVLDTNVLLHEPGCLNRFQDNHLCIPADVLSELDRFKAEQTERGANARRVHRKLTEIFGIEGKVTSGVKTCLLYTSPSPRDRG